MHEVNKDLFLTRSAGKAPGFQPRAIGKISETRGSIYEEKLKSTLYSGFIYGDKS